MPAPARVLVIDDDEAIRTAVVVALEAEGLIALGAEDGLHLLAQLDSFAPDLVIVDWMLPGPSGMQLAQTVRSVSDVSIVMLTARDEVDDRLRGFSAGVDDYVVKPFAMAELIARCLAVLRRRGRVPSVIELGDLLLDEEASAARRGGVRLELTATEFRLLAFLVASRGRTMTKGQILTQVWGYDDYDPNLVEVHLSSLRRKMEQHGPRLIHTVRGIGYRASVEGGAT